MTNGSSKAVAGIASGAPASGGIAGLLYSVDPTLDPVLVGAITTVTGALVSALATYLVSLVQVRK